jgi:hypothetical protein
MPMLDLRFVAPDLRALDALKCDAIALPFFEDERPLRGAAGLADWRMCGRISRLLLRGRVRGARGERVLVPARPRLSCEKLFLFGLGARASFDDSVFAAAIADMLETLDGVHARNAAIALPGRSLEVLAPERAIELFFAALADDQRARGARGNRLDHDELTVIDDLDAQRAMIPVLERARRRARALEV